MPQAVAPLTTARVDAWLWAVRLYKTRSAATAACRAGHVRVNGERVKAAQAVRVDDEIRMRGEGLERIVRVRRLVVKRVGAIIAADCLDDLTPPPPPKEEVVVVAQRERGAGRPTKRDRRNLDKLLGR
ncbi:MAG TPA: S4 domain-containing protein [Lacisediminihabitans sp.]|jgi:ribosome-associated heat shock protein Hsp15|nr:S4 domain-containing protein [Lacisediminihabitans sp.]HXD61618.1 S4 domain-containing protein [Lacisediminihabitans sp.]